MQAIASADTDAEHVVIRDRHDMSDSNTCGGHMMPRLVQNRVMDAPVALVAILQPDHLVFAGFAVLNSGVSPLAPDASRCFPLLI
jgi:hypothetical protein